MPQRLSIEEVFDVVYRSHAGARANGFWETDRNVGEMIALVHSEVSEACEAWFAQTLVMDSHLPHRQSRQVELADAYIRLADMLGGLGCEFRQLSGGEPTALLALRHVVSREDLKKQLMSSYAGLGCREELWSDMALQLDVKFTVPPRESIYDPDEHYRQAMSCVTRFFAESDWSAPVESCLLYLHVQLSRLLELYRKRKDDLTWSIGLEIFLIMAAVDAVYQELFFWRDANGNLIDVINEKLEYNKSRGYKHGKKF